MSHTPLEHWEPCRCVVKITEMGSQIFYCPLHAAAPKLLSALKFLHSAILDADPIRQGLGIEVTKKAILCAEGKG